MKYYGHKLKQIREANNLTQRQLEAKLGLGDSVISKWEKMAFPPLEGLEKACECFNIPLWQFFAPEDLIIPNLDPGEAKFMTLFKSLPGDLQAIIIEISTKTVEAWKIGKKE
jgi:transcriptional regulator with XRE-family HTH domain